MPVIFSNHGAKRHPYDTAVNGGAFLPYIYELNRVGDDIQILCRDLALNTVYQKLSYGRHFVASQNSDDEPNADPYLEPFAEVARNVVIAKSIEHKGVVILRGNAQFDEAYRTLPNTVLFNFFSIADTWLAQPTQQPIAKRWSPALPESYATAIETFVKMRPRCVSNNQSQQLTVLSKV